ncbi:tRNA adenosine deaminase-associated protein [Nocardioides sp.]|uniref:tRNA adenosine deaminase-associated protein n=1 Tax=Nocardioides sp. TaxID=35761 RepID=UPI00271E4111|nr:tRNA adenosine deaminase-associated protein [Nocardioides sp.]MDO9457876.1 tRNA adenosine deaminase-associated protein [Nocardioides sp.]
MAETLDAVDFAVAAYRDDGSWVVQELAHDLEADVDSLAHALRRFSGDAGALALVGLDDDYFLIVRVAGGHTRVLLSDIGAVDEWELAGSAVDFLRLPYPEDDDDQVPAGDLDLLGDLGLPAIEMGLLLDDPDLYPEELLSDIARLVGFGELFDDAVGLTTA